MSKETDKKEPDQPEIGARLSELIAKVAANQRQFALEIKANPQVINALAAGYGFPSGKTLHQIATRYKGFNATWLLTGAGDMFTDGRALIPTPAQRPADPRPVQPVMESEAEKWYKEQLRKRDEQIDRLTELLTTVLAGGSPARTGSFNLGDQDAAEQLPPMTASRGGAAAA